MSKAFGGMPNQKGPNPKLVMAVSAGVLMLMLIVLAVVLVQKQDQKSTEIIAGTDVDVNNVSVLIPKKKISEGEKLSRDMFRTEYRSRFALNDEYISDFTQIDGRFARSLILPDQPLYRDFITQYNRDNPIITKIPDGYRAISINVDATSGVEGWIRPGTYVDVQWITKVNARPTLIRIVERAQVLSSEKSTESINGPVSNVPTTVTLLVATEDADKIALSLGSGRLNLVLRNPEEVLINDQPPVMNQEDMYDSGPKVAPRVVRSCEGKLKLDGKEFCVCKGEMIPPDKDGKCR